MSTYLDFIPSPASIKAGDTEVHTGNPVDQVTITGDVNDFGVVIANQATDGDARITFSNNDRSYTLGLNGVTGSTNEDFRIVVGNNINAGTNVLSANHLGHLTIGRTTLTGGLQLRARTVTTNTTLVNDTDHIIFADATSGNIVLTLPANNSNADGSSTVGKEYIIIKTDSSANTVQIKGSAGTPGDTVNGSTNYLLRSQNETATVVRSTSSSWLVTASNKLPYFGNGSATNPSISFESDPDTGVYLAGSDQFGITTGGASRMVISSTGINVQNHKITNLGTPTANSDAATKAYVDGILTNVPVGTVGAAGLAFVGDPNTGIYQPSADQFGITTGGASRMVISSTGISAQNHKITNLGTPTANSDAATKAYVDANATTGMADGTAAAPGWAFNSDTDTGIYRPTDNQIGFATGGTARMVLSNAGISAQNHKITNLGTPTANSDAATKAYVDGILTNVPVGTASTAGLSFTGDPDTGIYRPSADQFGITTGGASRMVISSTGIDVQNHKITGLATPTDSSDAATKAYVDANATTGMADGTAAAPGWAFEMDPDTGFYRVADNNLGVTVGGSLAARFSSFGLTVNGNAAFTGDVTSSTRMLVPDGSETSPTYAFSSNTALGLYRVALGTLGITAGGALRLTVSSAGIDVQNHKITGLATPTDSSDAATKAYVDANAGTTGMADGTAAAPGWAFTSDTDTGLYLPASDQIGLATGGTPRMILSSSGINVQGHNITNLATPTTGSHASNKSYVDIAVNDARVLFAYSSYGVQFVNSTTLVPLADTSIQFSSSPGQWFTVQVLISCAHISDVDYPQVRVGLNVSNATVEGRMFWKTDAEQYSKRVDITTGTTSVALTTEPGNAPTLQYTMIRGEGRLRVITPPVSGPISLNVVGAQNVALNSTTLRAEMITLTRMAQ